ncbi:MAG TPA: MBL fold metallo-hydrolase, partial [Chloroflexota bacterium]|nr:MBL fold metallo-hydrolase [Chloroflexota bacterium]
MRAVGGGPVIYCDPFLTVRDDRSWQAPVGPADLARADLVLVSHEHIDHLDRPALKAAAAEPNARFTLILPRPLVAEVATELSLPPERIIGAQPDEPIEHLGVRV